MSCVPRQDQNPNGLHQRYVVTKANGDPCDPMATFFVLRLDQFCRDWHHVAACRAAALAYADYVQSGECPHLAMIGRDLRILVENLEATGGD